VLLPEPTARATALVLLLAAGAAAGAAAQRTPPSRHDVTVEAAPGFRGRLTYRSPRTPWERARRIIARAVRRERRRHPDVGRPRMFLNAELDAFVRIEERGGSFHVTITSLARTDDVSYRVDIRTGRIEGVTTGMLDPF
jgi:hypothetical protein